MFNSQFAKTLNVFAFAVILAAFSTLLAPSDVHAVPSFGHQTGADCEACHTVFPELTSFGRQFKLRGFSMGSANADAKFPLNLPLAGLLQISRTSTKNINTEGAMPEDFPKDHDIIVQAAGLYYAGKIITDKAGALVQYNYDGIESKWAIEMADIRYAGSTTIGNKELLYGLTLNNAPTLSDIYNSTPMWSFPNPSSAGIMAPSTLIDMTLAAQVGGLGIYALWNGLVYGEVALYHTASSGLFKPLGVGVRTENVVKNYAPYWRLALQQEWGLNSLSAGTFGMVADVFPDRDDLSTGTNRFTDVGFDAQYQYNGDNHQISTHASFIHEKQGWNTSFPLGMTSNPSDTLKSFKIDAKYFYKHKVGGGIGYFSNSGDADQIKYGMETPVMGSATGSPDTMGWIAELNYLPMHNVKLALRYTAYTKFNGASSNYDGFGRNASDNNNLYLLAWVLF